MEVLVPLFNGEQITLSILPEQSRQDALARDVNAATHLEAEVQLMEGCSYQYEIEGGAFGLSGSANTVKPFSGKPHIGRIVAGNYVGTLPLEVVDGETVVGRLSLEVRSYKSSYRQDYRHMLNYITEQCTEILLQHSSPVIQNLTFNFDADAETLYQRFAFVCSVIESEEFEESVHRILSMPVTKWKEEQELTDIRKAGRLGSAAIKTFAKSTNRLSLPTGHPLQNVGLESVPVKIPNWKRYETVDTPENRFVLFALTTFQQFCADVGEKLEEKGSIREAKHAQLVVARVEEWLSHSMFKEVGRPSMVPLNSPVLQRKEGYREVLRAWLMFDLAAKLVWKGGDDIYSAGKKDVAKLYEYWVFFKLLDKLSDKFRLTAKSVEELIKKTDDGLSLNLIEGQHTAIDGTYAAKSRTLRVQFSFNRTFSGKSDYPTGGSWTRQMRPDYTLTLWPAEMEMGEAEKEELIVHVHFDAKYKIDNVKRWVNSDEDNEEKVEAIVGSFKREDLLKMHAYKDAIRRTGGAYVLYPGEDPWSRQGFHEVIPGLGAFPLKPSKENDGSADLVAFIDKVVDHLVDRASQRERATYHSYAIHKDKPGNVVSEPLPERYGNERAEPVDETFVLVGYYREEQLEWIQRKLLYNTRTGSKQGTIDLGPKETGAKYLLLHGNVKRETSRLFKIVGHADRKVGPRIWSKSKMQKEGYPITPTSSEYYAVYKLDEAIPDEFLDKAWDVRKLRGYRQGNLSGLPFAVSLRELMDAKVAEDDNE